MLNLCYECDLSLTDNLFVLGILSLFIVCNGKLELFPRMTTYPFKSFNLLGLLWFFCSDVHLGLFICFSDV